MRLPNSLSKFVSFLIILSLALFPQASVNAAILCTPSATIDVEIPQVQQSDETSYDAILSLLEGAETGELENKYSPSDLEKLNNLLALLAQQGILPNETNEEIELEKDVQELLDSDSFEYSYAPYLGSEYIIAKDTFCAHKDIVLCGGWLKKKWKQTKKFIKKHRTAIIVGAAVVVAATVVIGIVAASTAAAAAGTAGAAAGSKTSSGDKDKKQSDPNKREASSTSQIKKQYEVEAPNLKAALEEQIFSFKENISKEQFLQSTSQDQSFFGENGRVLGSLFAHESFNNLIRQSYTHPQLANELKNMGLQNSFPITKESSSSSIDFGHQEIDRKFSSDYAPLYADPKKEVNFNTLSYQMRGERALASGHLNQAVNDLGKAIELDPTSPFPYLERGIAHFGLGQYDRSLEDYKEFTSQVQKTHPLSIPDFSLGFAKGLPKGIYDSGHGFLFFLSDVITHPINTGGQIWDALTLLSSLARSEQWDILGEVLVPEIQQLVKEWDVLHSDVRGEKAGYFFGKYGSDIIIPGALFKALSKGAKGAQELNSIYKSLRTAEKTLLLESAAGLESGAKIAEVVQLEKRISKWLGEGTKLIRNGAGDPIFLSKDGLRKLRFDFNRPAPHENPHLHFEHLVEGEWKEISRIYPIDVSHN